MRAVGAGKYGAALLAASAQNSGTGTGVTALEVSGYSYLYNSGSVALDVVGNLNVDGNLAVTGGTKQFKIDDPLDPAHKYLVHAADESPQAMNIYSGNITTDTNGDATVSLPRYFDAENRDPRYELTVIGLFARAVVWSEESRNQFQIRTDQGGVKVSWQVTAVRNDPEAGKSQGLPAEQTKTGDDNGRYLDPAAYGKPTHLAIDPPPPLLNREHR